MEKSLNYLKLDTENSESQPSFRCSKCSETFQKPILATLSSMGNIQTYNACPRCLSKVNIIKHQRREEMRESLRPIEKAEEKGFGKERDNADCQHYLGYLKKRPKDRSVPDECLTCNKMIECIAR